MFIGSEGALVGGVEGSVYCASKFALRGFAQSLQKECAKSGVRVVLINPGMVDTPFYDQAHFGCGEGDLEHLTASDVADAVCFSLAGDRRRVIPELNLSPLKRVIKKTAHLNDRFN